MAEMTIAERLDELRGIIVSPTALRYVDAIEAHMNQREKVIEAMTEYVSFQTGTCPNDLHDFEVTGTCERECGAKNQSAECWIEYFTKQVQAEEADGKAGWYRRANKAYP